ncbi:ribokinase [Marinomonas agarivorans]|nr:ribokinase [Marinomonas agarivorans]
MTIFNFGSINLDHLYQLDHFVRPGETIASNRYQCLLGGKGANQSVALAKAGAKVKHVGAIHRNDQAIIEQLQTLGVATELIAQIDVPTGHAIIQLDKGAENAIILYQGANHALTEQQVDQVLSQAEVGDWVLLQNETNLIDYIVRQAKQHQLKVAFNPAPMDVVLAKSVLNDIDLLIVNEVEAMDLLDVPTVDEAIKALPIHYPELSVLMTLGKAGVHYFSQQNSLKVEAFRVNAVDTTAAGDTFIGYCLAALSTLSVFDDDSLLNALQRACAASAICVTRLGAAESIPTAQEVADFLQQNKTP